jgi:predicted nucleic acid-binding protein
MNSNKQPRVLLDACVLYSAPVRDLFLSIASENVFIPQWTNQIQQEWQVNLLKNRPDLDISKINQIENLMNRAFPKANINKYSGLERNLNMPDLNDRHVLAAAIKGKSNYLTTFNLKDFPQGLLENYEIALIHPDKLLSKFQEKSPISVQIAFDKMVSRLKNPPKTKSEVKRMLEKCGLENISESLN